MRRLLIAPRAQADLNDIADYLLRTASPAATARVLGDLHAAMTRLADGSAVGHLRPDLTGLPVLFYRSRRYYVVHRIDGSTLLEVARVLHTARDVPSALA